MFELNMKNIFQESTQDVHFFYSRRAVKTKYCCCHSELNAVSAKAFHIKETSFPGIKERKLLSNIGTKTVIYHMQGFIYFFYQHTHRRTHTCTPCVRSIANVPVSIVCFYLYKIIKDTQK